MCPEPSVLSAFYDGELRKSASTEVAEHLTACPDCRLIVERFSTLSRELSTASYVVSREIVQRSRLHVTSRASLYASNFRWGRTITIPAPVAALAALLIVVLSAGLAFTGRRGAEPARSAAALDATVFDEIIEYLESRGASKPVTFTLPAFAQVQVEGDPVLVRAADYQRALR